jgi:hypothetical protein
MVEMLNRSGAFVDQVLAATKSASIGFAAYYAAIKEYPDRTITLRHKNSVVARWNVREQAAKLIIKDEARRIAVNAAKLPDVLRRSQSSA